MSADGRGNYLGADDALDHDYDPDDYDERLMPPAREEPDQGAIEDAEHCEKVHGGTGCTCALPTPEEVDAMWAEQIRQHSAEVHDGGPCDCTAPF